ncbi:MAG TPA: periplasmic heavy metal sensor [Chthoniobacterales bacterium]
MNGRALQLLLMLALVALVSAATCFTTVRVLEKRGEDPASAHRWIHRQLGLTADQDRALAPIEAAFQARKGELTRRIAQANAELATAIKEDKAETPRVVYLVEEIHAAQGDLQKATLQHVFDMQGVLRPDQSEKLLDLTARALADVDGEP